MQPALVVIAVVTGATLQRSTGLGFALVSGPFLVLVLSPYDGVALANVLSLITCVIVLASTYRDLDFGLAARLSLGVMVAVPVGALVARSLPSPALMVLVGALATVAVAVVAMGRPLALLAHRSGSLTAGFVSGFSNVTAGVGGPALAVYGASTRWSRVSFVPTVQLVGIVANVLSLIAKRDAHLPVQLVLGCSAAVIIGTIAGRYLSGVMGERTGRAIVLSLAAIGGLMSIVKGLVSW
ncbi:TSUP family transporter [Phytoactinopolyspora alkaliphila]|uniref:Probable membrane transporter protein n=1 Tax=Phytoactinopolyspora alkaliphila TaxID=1783498 RepID=A0A6N9YME2_9ACTN|nr:sulfite exporter TauE/SafE family protein [Phytoactinopolyspora alkaliphila]NED96090.1 TSUP family transporter [Phytoactinopolyspora alkaliphila]